MKRYALMGALVLLAGVASAETVGEKTGINSTLGIAPTTADFVHEAAVSDMFEIPVEPARAGQTQQSRERIRRSDDQGSYEDVF